MTEELNSFYRFLEHEKNYSVHTVDAYRRDLTQWAEFVQKENINWKTAEHRAVYSFLSGLHTEKGISKSSQARKVAAIKSFYSYCEKNDWLEKNHLSKLRPPKYRRALPRPLRPVELEAFLEDGTEQKPQIQLRDKAILEVLYSSGMRISEALPLNVGDVMDVHYEIKNSVLVFGKGSKERLVFLGEKAREALRTYLDSRPEKSYYDPLFINFRGERLTRKGASYILKKRKFLILSNAEVSPHSLRHTFATDMINSGADIRIVQEMLGHSSVSTTQNYTKVAKERIQNTFRECHPHAKKKDYYE